MSENESEKEFLQISKTLSYSPQCHQLVPPIVFCCLKERLIAEWNWQENCLCWRCLRCGQWLFPVEFPYRLQQDELVDLAVNVILDCSQREGWQQIPQSWLEVMVGLILKRCLEKNFSEEEVRAIK